MEIIWKNYPLDSRFKVSNRGLVETPGGEVTHGKKDYQGYMRIGKLRVHRMVAMAFLENEISDGRIRAQVNHKDGCRSNNNVENLEWCTSLENNLHAIHVLKRPAPMIPPVKRLAIKTLLEAGWSIRKVASALDVHKDTVIRHKNIYPNRA